MNASFVKKTSFILLALFLGACALFTPQQKEYARLQRLPASLSQSGLEELEGILQQADSLEEFLNNQELRESYYFHLLKYYGKDQGQVHSSGFKNYYQNILRSITQMTENRPELAERLWEKIDSADQKSFQVSGSLNSSGIALNAQNLENEYLPRLQRELREVVSEVSQEELQEAIESVLAEFERASTLSKREKGLAIKALKEGSSMRLVQAHFALKFLESSNVAEMIQTQDADIVMQALKRLPKISMYAHELPGGVQLPGLFNISDTSWLPALGEIEEYFEKARRLKRDFELIASAGTDDQLIRQTNQEKRELIERGSRENPLFYLETMEQAHNKKIILKQAGSGGKELNVVALPRRFHAVFRAARHDECVKEQCAKWGSAFMRDAEFYFTETSNQKMTGYLQVLPVKSERTGQVYGALEVMTPSTGGEVISLDEQGLKLKKTSKFDMMIEEMSERLPEKIQSLVISDGNGANNAGGKNAVYHSKAYILGDLITERPGQLKLVHDNLTENLPIKSGSSYSNQMFIGDGVNTNGAELRVLLPAKRRQTMTYEEFLPRYLKNVLHKNTKVLESMKLRAESSLLQVPDEAVTAKWFEGADLPLDELSSEDIKEVFNINKTFLKWLGQRDYRPGDDPVADRWIQDTEFFQDILKMIKSDPEHPGAQVFYQNASLRERFLNEGGRSLAAEFIVGGNREAERRFLGALSPYISTQELLRGPEVKRAVYDWFFESENTSSFSNLKKRKSFSMIEELFNPNDLFQEFKRRLYAGDYYQKREVLSVFNKSIAFKDLPTPLILEWESLLESESMVQFLKEEMNSGVQGDFLTLLAKKSEGLGVQDKLKSGILSAFEETLEENELSLESGLAHYLKNEKVLKADAELQRELYDALRSSPRYQKLLEESFEKKITLTNEALAWAEMFATQPIETPSGEKSYQEIMGVALSRQVEGSLNLERFQRHTTEVSFSNLLKAVTEKNSSKELPSFMLNENFLASFLDGLSERSDSVRFNQFTEGVKLEQRIVSTQDQLPRLAQGSAKQAQALYRLYQEHLETAPPALRAGIVENLNSLMMGGPQVGDDSLALILNSPSFPGLKLLAETREELVKKALNNDEFVDQLMGVYLIDFINDSQQASPAVRKTFFERLEGTLFEKRLKEGLVSALFEAGHETRAQALFKKPFIDLYPNKTVIAQQVISSALDKEAPVVFKQLGLLSQNLKADEFPYVALNDERFVRHVDQGLDKLRWFDAAPVMKFIQGETLEKLESSERFTSYLGKTLFMQDALIKGDAIQAYQNFFKSPEFYRAFFERRDMSQVENRLKFLMKANVSPLVEPEVMARELKKSPEFGGEFQDLLFSPVPERRKIATSFIQEFPASVRDNHDLLSGIRYQMTSHHRTQQANLLNVFKSKGGQTLLRQGKNREFLLESLKSADLDDVQKQRFSKALLDQADPTCHGMMESFL